MQNTETVTMNDEDLLPWYKQFWPWFIISIPALTVVAAMITIVIAVRSADGLVGDDYYKQGLAINQVLHRDTQAQLLGMEADVLFSPEGNVVEIRLSGERIPALITVKFMHATIPELDQTVQLDALGQGIYRGPVMPFAAGKWYVNIESGDGDWRLSGVLKNNLEKNVKLTP